MAIEIEKKYRATDGDFERIEDLLETNGAEFTGEDQEVNTVFSGGPLGPLGAIVRLRSTGTTTTLTYKRPLPDRDGAKQRIEIETEIADPQALTSMLAEFGMFPRLIYEKRRRIWRFGEVEVVLDLLPFGSFIEIEGSPEAIRNAETVLEIKGLIVEPETYPLLTLRFGREIDGVTEARFC